VQINLWNIWDRKGKHKASMTGRSAAGRACHHAGAGVRRGGGDTPHDPDPGTAGFADAAGERLTQSLVKDLAGHKRMILLCGRYEGFDERIRLGLQPREIFDRRFCL